MRRDDARTTAKTRSTIDVVDRAPSKRLRPFPNGSASLRVDDAANVTPHVALTRAREVASSNAPAMESAAKQEATDGQQRPLAHPLRKRKPVRKADNVQADGTSAIHSVKPLPTRFPLRYFSRECRSLDRT